MSARRDPARARGDGRRAGDGSRRAAAAGRDRRTTNGAVGWPPSRWTPRVWRQVVSLVLIGILAISGLALVAVSSTGILQAIAMAGAVVVLMLAVAVIRFGA